jgi:hypothetical protein
MLTECEIPQKEISNSEKNRSSKQLKEKELLFLDNFSNGL